MASRDHELWGWAVCWLTVPSLLPRKPQQPCLRLVASPRKKALFWGSSRADPPARQAASPSLPVAFHIACTEKRGKREENVSKILHTTSLCRQECPQHSHCATRSWAAGLLCCPGSGCHICPKAHSPICL